MNAPYLIPSLEQVDLARELKRHNDLKEQEIARDRDRTGWVLYTRSKCGLRGGGTCCREGRG